MPSPRPSSSDIEAVRAIVVALQDVIDYAPTNPECSVVALRELVEELVRTEEAEIRTKRAFEVAREQAVEAARKLYDAVMMAKTQVLAQYGSDSPVVHAVGLKQKSERKRSVRRARVK